MGGATVCATYSIHDIKLTVDDCSNHTRGQMTNKEVGEKDG